MRKLTIEMTDNERELLGRVAKAHQLSSTKLISKLLTDEAKRTIAMVGNLEEMDELLNLIEEAETSRKTRDAEWKKAVGERLTAARKAKKLPLGERRARRREYQRQWQAEYRKRQREIHTEGLSEQNRG